MKMAALACGLLSTEYEVLREFLFNIANSGRQISDRVDVIVSIDHSNSLSEFTEQIGIGIEILDDEDDFIQRTTDPCNPEGLSDGYYIRIAGEAGLYAAKWDGNRLMNWKYYGSIEKQFHGLKSEADLEMCVLGE
ncbi:MAG: hypothetical protein ABJZ54_06580 [Luteolibacter sp.]